MTAKKKHKRKGKTQVVTVGRATRYLKRYNNEVYKLCLLGAIDEDIAEFFDVSVTTINNWKLKHPTFVESMKRGKKHADACVAQALFHRACGYTHSEVKVFCSDGDIVTFDALKHYPPDTAAAFIWLKNRAGWKDKQEHEHGISKETATLLGMIDGTSKGKLPDRAESEDAGQ